MDKGGFMLHVLHGEISKLHHNYSTRTSCYKIAPNEEEKKLKNVSSLSLLVQRITQHIIRCPTDRKEQRDVFALLVKEYGTHSDTKTATYILLGALFYRYFRLLDSYDITNKKPSSKLPNFFSALALNSLNTFSSIDNCRLFIAIRKVLLPHLSEFVLEHDLSVLDGATVTEALECFKENMEQSSKEKKESFVYSDPDFLAKLDELIAQQRKRGEDIFRQRCAITFLTSLSALLIKENKLFQHELAGYLAHHGREELLTLAQMRSLPVSDQTKNNIALLLDLSESSFASMTPRDFIEKIQDLHLTRLGCVLMGANILLFKSEQVDEHLKNCINDMINMNNLDELLISVKLLRQYCIFDSEASEEAAALTFNVAFFGNDELFRTAVVRCYDSLQKEIYDKEHRSALAPA